MGSPIHDMQKGSGDVLVSNGYYAVNEASHVVLIPPHSPLKPSQRLATADDIAKAGKTKGAIPVALTPQPSDATPRAVAPGKKEIAIEPVG